MSKPIRKLFLVLWYLFILMVIWYVSRLFTENTTLDTSFIFYAQIIVSCGMLIAYIIAYQTIELE